MQAAGDIDQFKSLLNQNTDEKAQADLLLDFLKTNDSIGRVQTQPYFELLLQLAEKTGSAYHRAWGLYYQAVFNYFIGEYNTSQHLTQQVVTLFEQLNDKEGLANAWDNMASVQERKGKYTESLKLNFNALKIREELKDKYAIARSYNNIGVAYQYLDNYEESLKKLLTALQIRNEIGDEKGQNATTLNIGRVHSNSGNYPEALKSYFTALEMSEAINDKAGIADASNNIGAIYSHMGNYREALKNHLKTLALRKEIGDNYGLAMAYRNIGVIYQLQGNFTQAMANHLLALRIRKETGDKKGIADSYHAIGDIHQRRGSLPEASLDERTESYKHALENYKEALKIGEDIGNKRSMAYYYNSIGEIYEKQGNYPEAIKAGMHALKFGEIVSDKTIISESFVSLSHSYKSTHDFENALKYYELYHQSEKEMFGEQTQKQITNLSFQHSLEQSEKEAEIERLKNVELKEALEKLELEKLRSELLLQHQLQELKSSALQAQMNPHFVFNSLNSIQQFIWEKSPEEATAYLSRFSQLIRAVLDNSRRQYITVEQELISLEHYIELEALRFENKFQYLIICDPLIDEKEIQLPPMIIQPFAENAIIHGLQPLKTAGKLTITLNRTKGNILHITIEDNGIGRTKANQIKLGTNKSHLSVAIELTRERLQKMSDNELTDDAIIITDLYNENGGPAGTKVEINIPVEFSF